MKRKLRSTIRAKGPALTAVAALLALWSIVSAVGLVPRYMLPSPLDVVKAFIAEAPLLWEHSIITLQEAFYGLA